MAVLADFFMGLFAIMVPAIRRLLGHPADPADRLHDWAAGGSELTAVPAVFHAGGCMLVLRSSDALRQRQAEGGGRASFTGNCSGVSRQRSLSKLQ